MIFDLLYIAKTLITEREDTIVDLMDRGISKKDILYEEELEITESEIGKYIAGINRKLKESIKDIPEEQITVAMAKGECLPYEEGEIEILIKGPEFMGELTAKHGGEWALSRIDSILRKIELNTGLKVNELSKATKVFFEARRNELLEEKYPGPILELAIQDREYRESAEQLLSKKETFVQEGYPQSLAVLLAIMERDPQRVAGEGIKTGIEEFLANGNPKCLQFLGRLVNREIPVFTPNQETILAAAINEPGLVEKDISGRTGLNRPTVSRVTNRLVQLGLVEKKKEGKKRIRIYLAGQAPEVALTGNQEKIMNAIKEEPGIYLTEIARRLALYKSTVKRQANELQELGLVKMVIIGGKYRIYLADQTPAVVLTRIQQRILNAIRQESGLYQRELSRKTTLKEATVSKNIEKLEQLGLVKVERQGNKRKICYRENSEFDLWSSFKRGLNGGGARSKVALRIEKETGEIDFLAVADENARMWGLTPDIAARDWIMPFASRRMRALNGDRFENFFADGTGQKDPSADGYQEAKNNSSSPQRKTWLKRHRSHILQMAALIFVIGAWVIGFYFLDDIEALARYGYQGAFFVPMLDNFVTFINVGSFMIIAYLANILNPFLVGLLAGIGGTIGQFSSYLLGYSSFQFIIQKLGIYRNVARWMDKWGGKFIFVVSIMPLPIVGFTGIAAGAAKYSLLKYFLFSGLGNILKHIGYCFFASWILGHLLPKIYELASTLGVSDRAGLILVSIATLVAVGLFSLSAWVFFRKIFPVIAKFTQRGINPIRKIIQRKAKKTKAIRRRLKLILEIIAIITCWPFTGGSGQGGLSNQKSLSPQQAEALEYVFAALRAVEPLKEAECSSPAAIDSEDSTVSIEFTREITEQREVKVEERFRFISETFKETTVINALPSEDIIALIFKASSGTVARTPIPLNEPLEKTKSRIDEVLEVYLQNFGKINREKLEKGNIPQNDMPPPGSAAAAFKNLMTGIKTLEELAGLANRSESTVRDDVNTLKRLKLVIYDKENRRYKLNTQGISDLADPQIQQQIFEYLNSLPHKSRIYKNQDNEILSRISEFIAAKYNSLAANARSDAEYYRKASESYEAAAGIYAGPMRDDFKASKYNALAAEANFWEKSYLVLAVIFETAATVPILELNNYLEQTVRLISAEVTEISEATKNIYAELRGEDIFNQLLVDLAAAKPGADIQLLRDVFEFAKEAHDRESKPRITGEPYISHPVQGACILFYEFGITDEDTLAVALLHDVVEETRVTLDNIEKKFGSEIALGVGVLTKQPKKGTELSPANKREYFTNLLKGPVSSQIVKAAGDRLPNIRSLRLAPLTESRYAGFRERYFAKTRDYFIPFLFESSVPAEIKAKVIEEFRTFPELASALPKSSEFSPVDMRPVEYGLKSELYVRYEMAIRQAVNPHNEEKIALNGGSGPDWASFILSTDASDAYFVDKTKFDIDKLKGLMDSWYGLNEINEISGYIEHGALLNHAHGIIEMTNIEHKLLINLKAMGVEKKDIKLINNPDGTVTIKFTWAYLGQGLREYSITYIQADITDPDNYPQRLKQILSTGIDIYYQKAGFGIPKRYDRFLSIIAKAVKEGGYLVTDDYSTEREIFNPDSLLRSHNLNYTSENELVSAEMRYWESQVKFARRDDYIANTPVPLYLIYYGWRVRIRQKKEEPDRGLLESRDNPKQGVELELKTLAPTTKVLKRLMDKPEQDISFEEYGLLIGTFLAKDMGNKYFYNKLRAKIIVIGKENPDFPAGIRRMFIEGRASLRRDSDKTQPGGRTSDGYMYMSLIPGVSPQTLSRLAQGLIDNLRTAITIAGKLIQRLFSVKAGKALNSNETPYSVGSLAKWIGLPALFIFLADWITKAIFSLSIEKGVFFSVFDGSPILIGNIVNSDAFILLDSLLLQGIIIFIMCVLGISKTIHTKGKKVKLACGIALGGILANFLDLSITGQVVDWLGVDWLSMPLPVVSVSMAFSNLADIAIIFGMAGLISIWCSSWRILRLTVLFFIAGLLSPAFLYLGVAITTYFLFFKVIMRIKDDPGVILKLIRTARLAIEKQLAGLSLFLQGLLFRLKHTNFKLGSNRGSAKTDWVYQILLICILSLVLRVFVFGNYEIPSSSMRPTLVEGDRIIVNTFFYGPDIPFTDWSLPAISQPQRGDIIIFKNPQDKQAIPFIKRLIATEGEVVQITDGDIFIDGQRIDESKILGGEREYAARGEYGIGEIEVPEGCYYVLGDNVQVSSDSRYWGFVPEEDLIGKAVFLYWPFNRLKIISKNAESSSGQAAGAESPDSALPASSRTSDGYMYMCLIPGISPQFISRLVRNAFKAAAKLIQRLAQARRNSATEQGDGFDVDYLSLGPDISQEITNALVVLKDNSDSELGWARDIRRFVRLAVRLLPGILTLGLTGIPSGAGGREKEIKTLYVLIHPFFDFPKGRHVYFVMGKYMEFVNKVINEKSSYLIFITHTWPSDNLSGRAFAESRLIDYASRHLGQRLIIIPGPVDIPAEDSLEMHKNSINKISESIQPQEVKVYSCGEHFLECVPNFTKALGYFLGIPQGNIDILEEYSLGDGTAGMYQGVSLYAKEAESRKEAIKPDSNGIKDNRSEKFIVVIGYGDERCQKAVQLIEGLPNVRVEQKKVQTWDSEEFRRKADAVYSIFISADDLEEQGEEITQYVYQLLKERGEFLVYSEFSTFADALFQYAGILEKFTITLQIMGFAIEDPGADHPSVLSLAYPSPYSHVNMIRATKKQKDPREYINPFRDVYQLADRTQRDRSAQVAETNTITIANRFMEEFGYLQKHCIPELINRKLTNGNRAIRIWVIGCSTGEEARTFVRMLRDAFADNPPWGSLSDWKIEVIGTDFNPDALRQAGEHDGFDYVRRGRWDKLEQDTLRQIKLDYELLDLGNQQRLSGWHDRQRQGFDIISYNTVSYQLSSIADQMVKERINQLLQQEGYLITEEDHWPKHFLLLLCGFTNVFKKESILSEGVLTASIKHLVENPLLKKEQLDAAETIIERADTGITQEYAKETEAGIDSIAQGLGAVSDEEINQLEGEVNGLQIAALGDAAASNSI
ncbi:signal peptidase I [Candidatus Omnitrophota bacterium]